MTVFAACGSGEGEGDSGGGSSGTGGTGIELDSGLGAGGTGAGGTQTGSDASPIDGCNPDPKGCVGERYEGETIPLDIYIMFDQSCSMSCPVEQGGPGQCCMGGPDPRIDPVREAIDDFLTDPDSAGIGVGIGYFGYMSVGNTSCDPNDYATPDVEIGRLPEQAEAISASLDSIEPTGETPTGSAIRGACSYLHDWYEQNPGHALVQLLVTDGVPEVPVTDGCNASVGDAANAAEECLGGTPEIKTYVLGVGQALDNLNEIAEAGGTDQAYLVDGGDVANAVLEALNAIRADAAIPCELQIPEPPEGETLDLNQVNIGVCSAAGENVPTYFVETPEGCSGDGGWYYDTSGAEPKVVLCESSCSTVTIPGAKLVYSIGCATQTGPIH